MSKFSSCALFFFLSPLLSPPAKGLPVSCPVNEVTTNLIVMCAVLAMSLVWDVLAQDLVTVPHVQVNSKWLISEPSKDGCKKMNWPF